MSTTTTGTTAGYLADVRAELADLPATELEDVVDDVAGHLDEIARELEAGGNEVTAASLTARLGTPQQYAEELRTAAGYPARPGSGAAGHGAGALAWGVAAAILTPICALAWLTSGDRGLNVLVWLAAGLAPAAIGIWSLRGRHPRIVAETAAWRAGERRVRRIAAALPAALRRDLVAVGQPLWWALRGATGGVALHLVTVHGNLGWEINLPGLAVSALLGVLGSVWLARRSQRDRRLLWFLVPLNLVTVLAIAVLAVGGTSAWRDGSYAFDGVHRIPPSTSTSGSDGSGLRLDGQAIARLTPDRSRCTETATPPLVVPPSSPAPKR